MSWTRAGVHGRHRSRARGVRHWRRAGLPHAPAGPGRRLCQPPGAGWPAWPGGRARRHQRRAGRALPGGLRRAHHRRARPVRASAPAREFGTFASQIGTTPRLDLDCALFHARVHTSQHYRVGCLRRFFAEATGTLLCAVYGMRERCTPSGRRHIDYWISDGIYGAHAAVGLAAASLHLIVRPCLERSHPCTVPMVWLLRTSTPLRGLDPRMTRRTPLQIFCAHAA